MSLLPVPAVRQQKPGPPSLLATPSTGAVGYGTGDIVVTPPAGIPTGCKLLVGLQQRDGDDQLGTIPGVFSQVVYHNGPGHVRTFEGTHDGSASYTFTRSAYSSPFNWVVVAYSGTGVRGANATDTAWGTLTALETVTPTKDARLVAIVWVHDSVATSSAYTGWTEDLDDDMLPSVFTKDTIQIGGVASGAQTSTISHGSNKTWMSHVIALEKP